MAIRYRLQEQATYGQSRFALLARSEGVVLAPYCDSAGVATIGIGFAIRDHVSVIAKAILGSAAPDSLISALQTTANRSFATSTQVKSAFANTIADWNNSHGGTDYATGFAFRSQSQAGSVFATLAGSYETRLDRLVDNYAGRDVTIPLSQERTVLFSLTWNGVLGPKLSAALASGDRAEAWYEIRYNSNGGASRCQGIANRRYEEAERFGLYNNETKTDFADARQVAAMYSLHRDKILSYEAQFSIDKASQSKQMDFAGIAEELGRTIAAFVSHYKIAGTTAYAEVLVATKTAPNLSGDGTAFDTTANRNDILIGTSVANRLNGGKSADYMNGGRGMDVYIIDNTKDQVVDSDNGRVETGISLSHLFRNITAYKTTAANLTLNFKLEADFLSNAHPLVLTGSAGRDTTILTLGKGSDTATLSTGKGSDLVVVKPGAADSGLKTLHILDLSAADHIDLSAFNAKALPENADYDSGQVYYTLPSPSDPELSLWRAGADGLTAILHLSADAEILADVLLI